MKTYKVYVPFIVRVCVEVDADNEQEAIEEAYQDAYLDYYVGNGAIGDNYKICGVREGNMYLDVCDDPVDGDVGNIDPIVEEV